MDSSGSGTEINCPNCGEAIVIPEAETVGVRSAPDPVLPPPRAGSPVSPAAPGAPPSPVNPVNPIASSAAAKVEMHLRVPTNKHAESLIQKANIPLEVAAKETEKKVRVKTIRHTDCIEVGHDRFDEIMGNFLAKAGESNIISINTLNYTYLDIGTQKLLTDFGVLIVYRG